MNVLTKSMISTLFLIPSLVFATGHNHSHNHFNPALEQLGNDIISLTVCYRNGHLSDEDQEPVFTNLINHADVTGEELGMYYMDSLGAKTEAIMSDDENRILWTQGYCSELTDDYLNITKLEKKTQGHTHNHSNDDNQLDPKIIQQDIDRGRLLSIN